MLYGDDVDFKFVSDVGDLGYNAIDLLNLVEDGQIDCCYFFSSYLTERVNELNIFEIPFQIFTNFYLLPSHHSSLSLETLLLSLPFLQLCQFA